MYYLLLLGRLNLFDLWMESIKKALKIRIQRILKPQFTECNKNNHFVWSCSAMELYHILGAAIQLKVQVREYKSHTKLPDTSHVQNKMFVVEESIAV